MKTTGWCANTTTPTRKSRCTASTVSGMGSAHLAGLTLPSERISRRKKQRHRQRIDDDRHRRLSAKGLQHEVQVPAQARPPSAPAARRGVSVPPMETLTKSTPSTA